MRERSMNHPETHTDHVAVVTGSAQGFGQAIAVELARRGADIVAIDLRDAAETVAEVEAAGRRAVSIQADVTNPDAVNDARDHALGAFGSVDILVNNAGAYPFKDF